MCIGFFFQGYNGSQVGGNQVNCNAQKAPGPDQVCVLELQDFGPCSPEKQYGYNSSSPCVFLKLNRVSITSTYNVPYLVR